jgi:methylglutaconyl-CoA hydratase
MTVLVKKNLPSGTIVLDRPNKRNALSRQLIADLVQALDDLHQERKVRAVILTGSGSAFCAGMDLSEMHETSQQPGAREQWYEDAVLYRELLDKMLQFPKPIIAAVNGPALAGGMGLVLASDIVVAAKEAKLGLPEPKRGIVAGMVAPLLAFRLGGAHAAHLLLRGHTIEADEAWRIGLVHEVVEGDLIWARAQQIATEVEQSSPSAIQMTKRMLNETIGEHLSTLLTAGAAVSATARTTDDAAEGLAAFLAKRPAKWL